MQACLEYLICKYTVINSYGAMASSLSKGLSWSLLRAQLLRLPMADLRAFLLTFSAAKETRPGAYTEAFLDTFGETAEDALQRINGLLKPCRVFLSRGTTLHLLWHLMPRAVKTREKSLELKKAMMQLCQKVRHPSPVPFEPCCKFVPPDNACSTEYTSDVIPFRCIVNLHRFCLADKIAP